MSFLANATMETMTARPPKTDFYYLEPEVAGELGPHTRMDASAHPPTVHSLEYMLSDWLGDSLLASFPVYIVTKELGAKLTKAGLSGYALAELRLTKSPEFKDLEADGALPGPLPDFVWLQVNGQPGQDDFGLDDNVLVASQQALAILREAGLNNCVIRPYSP